MEFIRGNYTYEEVFEAQGVPQNLRTPQNFFIYEVTSNDSKIHQGEYYAIPRRITYEGGEYELYDNGTLVHENASVSTLKSLGNRAIIKSGADVIGSHIEYNCVIGKESVVHHSILHSNVQIGNRSQVAHSKLGPFTSVGNRSCVYGANVSDHVVIEDDISIEDGVMIDEKSHIRSMARLNANAYIGKEVTIGMKALINNKASIGHRSEVMERCEVKAGKKIRQQSIVFPYKFKRGYREHIPNQG